jgi:hypothetical protein
VPTARFFFDAGSGRVLWAAFDADDSRLGYPVDHDRLPISQSLKDELARLIAWYDTSMNWDYPPDPGPWREPECVAFNQSVNIAVAQLRRELGPDWVISNEAEDLHEDPDLDRYLADPRTFRR